MRSVPPSHAQPVRAVPAVLAVKQAIQGEDVTRSRVIALALVAVDVGFYIAALVGVLRFTWWPARVTCSIIAGLNIALLFILAHDACHGSFTPSPTLNAFIGRLCFLPALFPFSPWEHGHNRLHHGWTNLSGKDYVWCPFSLEEFRALPRWRRALERTYRTTPGVALYAIVGIWWGHMICPSVEDRRSLDPVVSRLDRALVATYIAANVLIIAPCGGSALVLCLLVPWVVFNWLFGMVILQHHTHPHTRWFRTREEWTFYSGQIANTVHVVFPRAIDLLLHNITVHGAHHVDPKVPLYKLSGVQSRLEQSFGADMIIERWSLATHRKLLRTCRLFDYEHHCWLDFDGTPTSPADP
jgi:omega-6 fatty acid desaturase (delta-12 desaturase)